MLTLVNIGGLQSFLYSTFAGEITKTYSNGNTNNLTEAC